MANYNVDISIAVKNTAKLTAFNKQLDKTAKLSAQATQGLKEIGQTAKINLASLNNLSTALNKAKKEFNDTVLGTKASVLAARDLASAERMVNKELKEREALLRKFRFQGGGSAFKSFSQSASQITSPNVLTIAQQKSIDRQNRKRGRTPVPFGPQQFIGPLPMQGPMFGPMQGPNPMMTVDNNPRILRNLAASQASREASAFRIRPGTQFERPIGPAFSAVMKSQLRHQKKIDKNTGKTAQLLSASNNRAIFGDPNQFATPIGPQPATPSFFNRMGFGKRANPGGMFASVGGATARGRSALQSGLIGGGFPLLFGQGGAGAIAGGLGGLAGGALSPGFGFAGSIVATAAAQEIQKVLDFREQVSKLNMEMISMGISSNISANSITKLGKSLGVTKEEAVKVLEQFKRFGEESIGLAKFFGGDFALFESFSQADNVTSVLNAIKQSSKELTQDQELRLTRLLAQKGAEAAINELIDIRRKKIIDLKIEQNKKRSPEGSLVSGLGVRQAVDQSELNKLIIKTDETIENLNKIKDNVTQQKLAVEEVGFSIVSEIEKIDKELRKLNNTQFQTIELSNAISSSFEDSFKGIIKGTMTAQEALRNLFQRTANHFLDMAAQMIAKQIQLKILGIGLNFAGGLFSGGGSAGANNIAFGSQNLEINKASNFPGFADGGRPPVGRASIVGERGPELFVPDRAGTIVPNNAMGGSTSIVVNVDASGSSVQSDGDGKQFGEALATAIQLEIVKQKRSGGLLA